MISILYKAFRSIKYKVYPPTTTFFGKIILILNGVKFSSVQCSGVPCIHVSRSGVFEIGEKFAMCSWRGSYVSGVTGKCKIEVRNGARLNIGNSVGMTMTTVVCHEAITIEDNVKLGVGVHIYDTDFHALDPVFRSNPLTDWNHKKTKPILIKENVFIGAFTIVLKGVTIGENSVIGAGSVVSRSIPANVIAAGNPCVVIKELK